MSRPRLDDIVKRKTEQRAVKVKKVSRVEVTSPPKTGTVQSREAPSHVGRNSRYMLWSVAAISVAFLLLAFSFLFGKARAVIFPKTQSVILDDTFSAAAEPGAQGLGFELVAISGAKTATLSATEERELAQRAGGTVIIFNSYNSSPQRLDPDTRLAGSNGKLYKTRAGITVPGMKANGTPGSVEVGIYAAEPGAEYNSGPIDFHIVGFRGTPKYEKFKVRSKPGTEITGGFVGTTLIAPEAEKQKAAAELEIALKQELYRKAADQIPEGFMLYENAAAFTVDKLEFPLGTEKPEVRLEGTLRGLLLREEALSEKIAERKIAGYKKGEALVFNVKNLDFTLLSPAGPFTEPETISFKLSGPVDIVARVDAEKFTEDILGLPKRDFTSLLSRYENIDRVELTLSPLWKRVVPEEHEKVEVVVKYPEQK